MSTIRANTILDASGGNTATINGVTLRTGTLDPENRIINGGMDFWQRGTSGTANGYVAADRWGNLLSGGTITQSRQSFTLGDTLGSNSPAYFLRQTVSGQSLSASFAITFQRIEGVRSYAGQTITVLGWARRSSGTGNMVVEVEQGFGTGGSPPASVTAPSVTISLTGSWMPFAATISVPSILGKTLGTDGNNTTQINFWTSAGSDWNSRTNSLGLQTIGVDLWGIHIKLGTHTTVETDLYKQPELGPELERCQRYYQQYLTPILRGVASGSNLIARLAMQLPISMRAAPTASVINGPIAVYDGVTTTTATASVSYATSTSYEVDASIPSAVFVVGRAVISYNNGTWQLALDAEL